MKPTTTILLVLVLLLVQLATTVNGRGGCGERTK